MIIYKSQEDYDSFGQKMAELFGVDYKTTIYDPIEIIPDYNTFGDPWNKGMSNIYSHETRVSMGVRNIGNIPWNKNKKHSLATILKIKEKRKTQIITEEHKRKISESIKGENHPLYGKKHSKDTIDKMSLIKKGKLNTLEQKEKISETMKNKPALTCSCCGKIGKGNIMYRYHFGNCKNAR